MNTKRTQLLKDLNIPTFESVMGNCDGEKNINCSKKRLRYLYGAPKKVGGYFDCYDNKVKFTEEDVRKVCKVGGKIYV